MNILTNAVIFADGEINLGGDDGTLTQTTVSSLDSVMGPVRALFVVIGIVILLLVVFKVAKAFAKGDFGSVLKVGVGGIVAAVLCFNLNLPITIIDEMGTLAGKIFTSAGNIAETGSTPGSTPAAT